MAPISTPRDQNRVPTLLATLNTDGVTVVSVQVNPTNNALAVSNGVGGSTFPSVNSQRDANRVPAVWGISNADGVTPIPIYCDASGKLLIKST